jgi:hypothetical protein
MPFTIERFFWDQWPSLFSEDAAKFLQRRSHIAQGLNILKRTIRRKTLLAHYFAGVNKVGVTYIRDPGALLGLLDELFHHPHDDNNFARTAPTILETSCESHRLTRV